MAFRYFATILGVAIVDEMELGALLSALDDYSGWPHSQGSDQGSSPDLCSKLAHFRATASTILNSRGFDPDVIEAALAHQDRNAMRRA